MRLQGFKYFPTDSFMGIERPGLCSISQDGASGSAPQDHFSYIAQLKSIAPREDDLTELKRRFVSMSNTERIEALRALASWLDKQIISDWPLGHKEANSMAEEETRRRIPMLRLLGELTAQLPPGYIQMSFINTISNHTTGSRYDKASLHHVAREVLETLITQLQSAPDVRRELILILNDPKQKKLKHLEALNRLALSYAGDISWVGVEILHYLGGRLLEGRGLGLLDTLWDRPILQALKDSPDLGTRLERIASTWVYRHARLKGAPVIGIILDRKTMTPWPSQDVALLCHVLMRFLEDDPINGYCFVLATTSLYENMAHLGVLFLKRSFWGRSPTMLFAGNFMEKADQNRILAYAFRRGRARVQVPFRDPIHTSPDCGLPFRELNLAIMAHPDLAIMAHPAFQRQEHEPLIQDFSIQDFSPTDPILELKCDSLRVSWHRSDLELNKNKTRNVSRWNFFARKPSQFGDSEPIVKEVLPQLRQAVPLRQDLMNAWCLCLLFEMEDPHLLTSLQLNSFQIDSLYEKRRQLLSKSPEKWDPQQLRVFLTETSEEIAMYLFY